MKPIIGITVEPKRDPGNSRTRGTLTLNWNYPEAIAAAGGLPMLIPPTADMEQVAKLIDGPTFLCVAEHSELAEGAPANVKVETFAGPHPAGTVGGLSFFCTANPPTQRPPSFHP